MQELASVILTRRSASRPDAAILITDGASSRCPGNNAKPPDRRHGAANRTIEALNTVVEAPSLTIGVRRLVVEAPSLAAGEIFIGGGVFELRARGLELRR